MVWPINEFEQAAGRLPRRSVHPAREEDGEDHASSISPALRAACTNRPSSPIRAVWSFGEMPVVRGSFLQLAYRADFAVPDRKGRVVHLSDFRGKKVLVVTWASW